MDADEWQVLELSGAYLFIVEFAPRAWFDAQRQPVELIGSEDRGAGRSWWQYHEPAISVSAYLDGWLTRADNWPYEHEFTQTSWSDENFHRVELWESNDGGVAYLEASVDARYEYADFLSQLVCFASTADCMLYIESERTFLEPSSEAVYLALNRSNAARLAHKNIAKPKNHEEEKGHKTTG